MYDYKSERSNIFTDDGLKALLKIRDNALRLTRIAGCFQLRMALEGITGSSFTALACIDYLVEIGELILITQSSRAQYDVYRHTGV